MLGLSKSGFGTSKSVDSGTGVVVDDDDETIFVSKVVSDTSSFADESSITKFRSTNSGIWSLVPIANESDLPNPKSTSGSSGLRTAELTAQLSKAENS